MSEPPSWEKVRAEIISQAEALDDALEVSAVVAPQVAALAQQRQVDRILVVGAGGSFHAAQAMRWWLEDLTDLPVEPMETLEYLGYAYRRDTSRTLIVVISASGRRSLTLDALLRALAGPGLVIGVTDAPASPFATHVQAAFVTHSQKYTGWPTQTTTVALGVLASLAIALADPTRRPTATKRLREVVKLVSQVAHEAETPMSHWAGQLADHQIFGFVGAGPALGVANNGMMLLTMAVGEYGIAWQTEEVHHGGQAAAAIWAKQPIFVIAPVGAGETHALATLDVIESSGGQGFVLGPASLTVSSAHRLYSLPQVEEMLSPLLYAIPLQWFAYYLAQTKLRRGIHQPHAMLIRALYPAMPPALSVLIGETDGIRTASQP